MNFRTNLWNHLQLWLCRAIWSPRPYSRSCP